MQAQMTEIVMPGDANHLGTCFGGKIMSWIDMVAAIAAQRLVGTVVTASVDSIQFRKPIAVGDLVTLKASINRVWNSSMEVGVTVLVQSHVLGADCDFADVPTHYVLSKSQQACRAYLTFVAVDDTGKRRDISKKQEGFLCHHDLGSSKERRWEEAQERREVRLANRKEGH